MSQPPLPPPLDHRGPSGPKGPEYNQWWKVGLRILAGVAAGVGSGCLGLLLANRWDNVVLLLGPPLVVLGVAIFVAVKWRRRGYVTGVMLAPFVIAVVGFVLLLIICGNRAGR